MPLRGLAYSESNAVDRRELRADAPLDMPLDRRISSVFLRRFPQIQFRKEVTSFAFFEELAPVILPIGSSIALGGWIEIACITASEVFVNPLARALPPSSCAADRDEGLRRTVLRESSVVALAVTGRIRRE